MLKGVLTVTKEQELMDFLHENVFDPILRSPDAPAAVKSGVQLTIARMSKLSAEGMIRYYWSALSTDNAIRFSDRVKAEGLPRFEDVLETFRVRFNDDWLRKG